MDVLRCKLQTFLLKLLAILNSCISSCWFSLAAAFSAGSCCRPNWRSSSKFRNSGDVCHYKVVAVCATQTAWCGWEYCTQCSVFVTTTKPSGLQDSKEFTQSVSVCANNKTRNLAIANTSRVSCAHKVTLVCRSQKWPSKVTQGHLKCRSSIERIPFRRYRAHNISY